MASIVSFPNWAGRRTPDFSDPGPGGAKLTKRNKAEIVIFPGIRIERQKFSPADRLPARPGLKTGKPRHERG
ncbi:hypothetical protein MNBD_ALPHA09-1764 [hydrothermal vent metagenome]|uniref:Uncharacterized protein n=1 Tax=hydrothermal vent metagenome TaxID=652676 RepID=A0A3B0TJY2_9ZZZZ